MHYKHVFLDREKKNKTEDAINLQYSSYFENKFALDFIFQKTEWIMLLWKDEANSLLSVYFIIPAGSVYQLICTNSLIPQLHNADFSLYFYCYFWKKIRSLAWENLPLEFIPLQELDFFGFTASFHWISVGCRSSLYSGRGCF